MGGGGEISVIYLFASIHVDLKKIKVETEEYYCKKSQNEAENAIIQRPGNQKDLGLSSIY